MSLLDKTLKTDFFLYMYKMFTRYIYSILKLVNVLKLIWKMFQMQLDHNCTFLETKYYAYDNCNVLIMFFL